ncbi:DUF1906 domain-containing protein [Streptomyces sp. NPDC020983]|uniref:DUF1906 domain-containing protein n=1 Tax=Streptomyces sp. NPDC020983 TaxID=3365106 RepID=UPI0037B9E041
MSDRSGFVRYVRRLLVGILTMTGLLLPAAGAAAVSDGSGADRGDTAPRIFQGSGFDTCQAPDLATMRAWRASSAYGAVGIYFGGRARACKSQLHLTTDWVQQTTADGWGLLPIYVGSQSPCVTGSNKNPYRIDPLRASAQGGDEGEDAVAAAQALGLDKGSPLYLDMEAYDTRDADCDAATLTFVRAWDRAVRAAGYLTGFYSSADSGIRHMETARRAGVGDLPDVVWYARWGVDATLTDEPVLAAGAWPSHARIHQYTGSVTETHGGSTLTIDRDLIDAPVAIVAPAGSRLGRLPAGQPRVHPRPGPARHHW